MSNVAERSEKAQALLASRRVGYLSTQLTLMGEVTEVPEDELEAIKAMYLATHPGAVEYAEFSDFGFFRFHTADSYYVGGFGEMGWL
jgi:hypothetical protein